MKTKLIALSAISAALTAIMLSLGAIFELIDLVVVCFAPIFFSMPLYFDSKKGAILASFAGGLIAVFVNPFSLVGVLHFSFFGIFPIIKYVVLTKKLNKVLFNVLSMFWFAIVCVGAYFFYFKLLGNVPNELFGLQEWVFVLDRFIYLLQVYVFRLLRKIIK